MTTTTNPSAATVTPETQAVAAALCRAANARWPDPADKCLLPPGSCDGCKDAAEDAVRRIAGQ